VVEVVAGRIVSSAGLNLQPGFNPVSVFITDTVCLGAGDVSKLAPCHKLIRDAVDARAGEPCESGQAGATLLGNATCMAYVCRNCECNARNALVERHGVAQPPVADDMKLFVDYLASVRCSVCDLFIDIRADWQDGWIAKWAAVKQRLIMKSVDDDAILADRVKMMVKRELASKYPSKARGIQYYVNLATQALFGPEFYALQKAYTAWFQRRDVGNGIRVTMASGLNATDLGEWMKAVMETIPNPHFYERDGKSWDATMQAAHLAVRMAAYDLAGEDFCAFVASGFSVTGNYARGALKYKLFGTVKSGHNDTTLGNSLVNMAIAVCAMRVCGLRGDIIVAGDDLLIVVEGDFDEAALAAAERACGIVPEFRKFSNPSDVSFISGVWFPAADTWLFMPKPGRLLARLFWSVRPPPPKRRQAFLNSIVLGLMPTCRGMPVIDAFLSAHYDPGVTADRSGASYSATKIWSRGRSPGESMMGAFCARYSLNPDDVRDAEELITQARGRQGFLCHPVFDRLMAVDLADLADRPLSAV